MSTLYLILLALHNINRWVLLVSAIWTLISATLGLKEDKPLEDTRRAQLLLTGSVHLQLVLGLMLFAVMGMSQIPTFAGAPRSSYVVEHLTLGLVVAVVATVGGVLTKRAATPAEGHKRALIWTGATVLLALLAVPWFRSLLPNLGG